MRSRGLLELIDTLWNVNSDSNLFTSFKTFELIDTLWNVNNDGHQKMSQAE